MALTAKFEKSFTDQVIAWRNAGASKRQALRDGELLCGKSGEEFRDGKVIVDEVYADEKYKNPAMAGIDDEGNVIPKGQSGYADPKIRKVAEDKAAADAKAKADAAAKIKAAADAKAEEDEKAAEKVAADKAAASTSTAPVTP